jgi:hypothetical protein
MSLIWFLLRASWVGVVVAAIAGSISGIGSASSIALISHAIRDPSSQQLIWGFAGLGVVVVSTNLLSKFVLAGTVLSVDLSTAALFGAEDPLLSAAAARNPGNQPDFGYAYRRH